MRLRIFRREANGLLQLRHRFLRPPLRAESHREFLPKNWGLRIPGDGFLQMSQREFWIVARKMERAQLHLASWLVGIIVKHPLQIPAGGRFRIERRT